MRVARWLVIMAAGAGCTGDDTGTPPGTPAACDPGNAALTLPAGFCATIFADNVGIARQIAVAPSGDVYVVLSGAAVLALRDTNADGHADLTATAGRASGTGISLQGNYLYVDAVSVIVRYQLIPGQLAPSAPPDTIVRGLPQGGHQSRSVAASAAGDLFVNVGSAGNNCEAPPRDPCAELQTRGGVWRFSAATLNQQFTPGARFATGIRNAVGMTVNPADGDLYVVQHGRDNLQNYPSLFDADAAAESPGEELFRVNQGDDFGWPYCYYDRGTGARVLGPDYGGNRQTVGRCATSEPALTVFPGHWAPNGIAFHPGTSFPARYAGGAFVTMHGSWNRAPRPQQGYRVVFVPATGSGLGSAWETFADGFAETVTITDPMDAAHRPSGIAVGPDGAIYVTDDRYGRIYRIVYAGN